MAVALESGTQETSGMGGAKTIGLVGSLAVLLNNILGPGIANFSSLYQQSGWLPPTLLVLVCVASSIFSGAMLLASMRAYPNNQDFDVRVEYGTLCRYYFPSKAAKFFQGLFQLAMLTANISNIIQTAQVFDYFFDTVFGDSCALMFYPSFMHGFCQTSNEDVTPFGAGKVVLSLGMGTVGLVSIPLGYWNLEDNVKVQNAALVVILLSILLWVLIFFALGLEAERVPAVGTSLHNMGGTILFNFMFISTVPSWVCEKKPGVPPLRTILGTLVLAVLGYLLVGVIGGMAFEPYFMTDNTLLSQLNHISPQDASPLVRSTAFVTVQAYAISANLASIPIFSILMRYNLIESKVVGSKVAGAASVLVPFGVAVLLYTGEGFKNAIDFSGTFTSSFVNLMAPSLFFLSALKQPQQTALMDARECMTSVNIARPFWKTSAWDSLRSETAEKSRLMWRIIAWVNLSLMAVLTLVSVVDQFA
ncbi:unnamed protein product [Symbiodinium pilosum]|uniref:Amino acid transporter transmembrane domain-containing protein n=1 Tax=Symbiodinium pilosum TaxID=2952 RepID=A0A812XET0_SYMPI|nr:unnamed protein product [Symbiodinium pilosum]